MTRCYVVHMPAAEARHLAGLPASWPPIPARGSLPARPVRGPFGPRRAGLPLPGRVTYLGDGAVRLDEIAVSSLACLPEGEDFRAVWTDAGPLLQVGADCYPAREEPPDPEPGPLIA